MKTLLPIMALFAAGCTSLPPPHGDPVPPQPPVNEGECNAAPAQALVGRQASPELAAEAQRLTGARTWRWLRPGQVVTMEYRGDRLNLHLDAQEKIERIVCG
jgi:hypothetical protein